MYLWTAYWKSEDSVPGPGPAKWWRNAKYWKLWLKPRKPAHTFYLNLPILVTYIVKSESNRWGKWKEIPTPPPLFWKMAPFGNHKKCGRSRSIRLKIFDDIPSKLCAICPYNTLVRNASWTDQSLRTSKSRMTLGTRMQFAQFWRTREPAQAPAS